MDEILKRVVEHYFDGKDLNTAMFLSVEELGDWYERLGKNDQQGES